MRFGDILRQARSAKGLTQAELGAGVYSTRYISLLECGQRQPTTDMLQHFATRLGMDVQTLSWWVEPPSADDQSALTSAMFAAHHSRDLRDDTLAASEAEYAASIASEQRNGPSWWDMSMLQAQSLINLRRLEEAETVLLRVQSSSLLVQTPELRAVVQMRLSLIARGTGRLLEAVDLAHSAVELAAELPDNSPARLQAAFILIAALAVKGDLDEAWNIAMSLDLTENVPAVPSRIIAHGAWAIGNVAFRRGEVAVGYEQHALAAKLLLPQADLEMWTNFHKSSATLKVEAGIVDESVRESIRNAEVGLELVGTKGQQLELLLAKARFALLTPDLAAAAELLGEVNGQRENLDFESGIELESCLGHYYVALKSRKQATHHLSEAARLYTEAGADEKAHELLDQVRALGA
jgi:transcriptional regulator with XRE-family HTH domain